MNSSVKGNVSKGWAIWFYSLIGHDAVRARRQGCIATNLERCKAGHEGKRQEGAKTGRRDTHAAVDSGGGVAFVLYTTSHPWSSA